MLKRLLFLFIPAFFLYNNNSVAQFRYTFNVSSQAYTPLSPAATLLSGARAWNDTFFAVPMPFPYELNGMPMTSFFLDAQNLNKMLFLVQDPNSMLTLSGFVITDADLVDRGYLPNVSTPSRSPVSYEVVGTIPDRIFKFQMQNVGFIKEQTSFNTLNDSMNLQVWLYENGKALEFRYGLSTVNHPDKYFLWGGSARPFTGYLDSLTSLTAGTFKKIYGLSGPSVSPVVDSTISLASLPLLINYPVSNLVYRFTPIAPTGGTGGGGNPNPPTPPNSVASASEWKGIKAYPTLTRQYVTLASQMTKPVRYEIIAANGSKTNQSGVLPPGTSRLDVGGLAAGTYSIRLSDGASAGVIRFVKQ